MRILYYELRKLWRLPVVLVILALGVMYYYLFMEFHIRFFPNGHPETEKFELVKEWTQKYGVTMEPEEYADAQESYAELVAEADAWIAADGRFAAKGIPSWEGFLQWREEKEWDASGEGADEYWELEQPLFSEESGWIGFRIQSMEGMLRCYEIRDLHVSRNLKPQTPAEKRRFDELREEPRVSGIFFTNCIGNLTEYACWAGIFAVASAVLLLAPAGAREHLSHMPAELWTSRTGRRTCRYQFAAAMLSAAGLFVLELLAFGGIYSTLGTSFFWDSPTSTFLVGPFFWFDLTYGQYVLCILGMLFLLVLGTAGAAFVLSHTSTNYISVILKALPLVTALIFAAAAATDTPFTSRSTLYQTVRVIGIEAVFCGLLCLCGLAAGGVFLWRAKRKELL